MALIRRKDRLTNARWARVTAWNELLSSTDQFQQAELLFKWRTDYFREKYGLAPDAILSIEALMDRDKDEHWKNSIADAKYHAERMQAFAALHRAAMDELGLLEVE